MPDAALLNFGPHRPILCRHCGKAKNEHQAHVLACPGGRKHRTHGWPWFHATDRFDPTPPQKDPPDA